MAGLFAFEAGGGVGVTGLFASKPAPTFDRTPPEETRSNVGAGLLAKTSDHLTLIHRLVTKADNAAIASGDFNRCVNNAPSSSIT